jgi:hypothetical protein
MALTFFLTFFHSCQSGSDSNTFHADLNVGPRSTGLYKQAGTDSDFIQELKPGTELLDLGEVSRFSSRVIYDGKTLSGPWIKVQTSEGTTGWVFLPDIQTKSPNPIDWMYAKHLSSLLGKSGDAVFTSWEKSASTLQDETVLAQYYRESISLQNTLNQQLRSRPTKDPEADFSEYNWLEERLPCFALRYPHEAAPEVKIDYTHFAEKARKTSGEQDNQFFQLCLKIYPLDSLESDFPVWLMPLSLNSSCSQLGDGSYLRLLRKINQLKASAPIFKNELDHFQNLLLESLWNEPPQFWQAADQAQSELDSLIQLGTPPLQTSELESLKRLKIQMQAADSSGIRFNLRSGLY